MLPIPQRPRAGLQDIYVAAWPLITCMGRVAESLDYSTLMHNSFKKKGLYAYKSQNMKPPTTCPMLLYLYYSILQLHYRRVVEGQAPCQTWVLMSRPLNQLDGRSSSVQTQRWSHGLGQVGSKALSRPTHQNLLTQEALLNPRILRRLPTPSRHWCAAARSPLSRYHGSRCHLEDLTAKPLTKPPLSPST